MSIRHGLLIGLGLVAGCGSVVTFSKVSREAGIEDYNAGRYVEAEGRFADAIRQNPRDYTSHAYLARLYDRQKQYANATAHYKLSLEVQQMSTEGRADKDFRIQTLGDQADTIAKVPGESAVNDLETRSQTSTTGEEAYQLARVFTARGDADSAIAAYDKAASQAPGQFYIAKAQGLYRVKLGQKAQAEAALRRAYKLKDTDVDVNGALRGLGVVPGPSLKDETQMKKPLLPTGPLPDWLNREK